LERLFFRFSFGGGFAFQCAHALLSSLLSLFFWIAAEGLKGEKEKEDGNRATVEKRVKAKGQGPREGG